MTALKIPVQDRTLAMNLLKNQSQQLQTSHGYSHRAYPKRGVAQGASESPTLFSWFLEPLIRKLAQDHDRDGYSVEGAPDCDPTTITSQLFADDCCLVSSTAAGMQRMLDTVGQFCRWAGLTINVGREKSASCNSDNAQGHQFYVQDSKPDPTQPRGQPIFQLDGSPYRYLGTKFLEKDDTDADWLPEIEARLEKLRSKHSILRLRNISARQICGIVKTYMSSTIAFSAALAPYPEEIVRGQQGALHNTTPCDALDQCIYEACRDSFRYREHFDHEAVFLPQHSLLSGGLGLQRTRNLQSVESCCETLANLNSLDPQVRNTTRSVLHQLRARGRSGRKIGAGIGLFIRDCLQVTDGDGESVMHLLHTRTPDVFQSELPTCWLANVKWSHHSHPAVAEWSKFTEWEIDFLCSMQLTTVDAVREWAFASPPEPEEEAAWTSAKTGIRRTPRKYFEWKWWQLDISTPYRQALETLRSHESDHEGEQGTEQVPWPSVDGRAHPTVLMNVDGSKFTDPNVTAGAGVLVNRPNCGWWDEPILQHCCRCIGSQTSNRSEALALLIGLRTCRSVPKIHCMTDSQFVKDGVDKFRIQGIQSATNRTAHRDLFHAILVELSNRDTLYPADHFYLEKVKSHDDTTPITHDEVDLLAKEAAKLPLPQHWQRILSPSYTVFSGGLTHNETELRTLLTQRLRKREVADLPVHLRHLALPSMDHSLAARLWDHLKHPSLSETLLRLRFGITRVLSEHTLGVGHSCKHCAQLIRGADGSPITTDKLHGTEYVSHMLFQCPSTTQHRSDLQQHCDTFTTTLRAQLGDHAPAFCMTDVVADVLLDHPGSDGQVRLDPRGFCNDTIRQQLNDAGADVCDLVKLYTACEPTLYAALRLATFGQQNAAAHLPAA